ncbi:hypothetical protein ACH5RR_008260 [Cinchona calisaya]|uniref:Small ribosomal subunit protein uS15c n=1 Tax=Cinchona calisaya TaxID=153742 RepID=A0ABD3ACR4_9GENT
MKLHLVRERGSVAPCTKVAPEVRHAILGSLKEYAQKAKEKRGDFGKENLNGCSVNDFDGDDIQEIPPCRVKGISINVVGASAGKGKRKATTSINAYFKSGRDTLQPTIKACLQSKEKWHNIDMPITLWTNRKRSYDPVDYESIDKIEFGLEEEEPVGKLDYEELEAKLEELPVDDDIECSNSQQVEYCPPPNLDEISRNLSEFRRRSAAPPPSPPSSSSAPQHISFQELYQRNVVSKGEESSDSYKKQHSFEAIRESLRHFKPSPSKNPSSQGGRGMDNSISLSRFRESLATRQMDPNVKSSPSDQRVFGVEIKKKEEGESGSDGKMRTEFVRTYSREDLGEKLRALRPEKMDKKDWFSLEELSQRLVKLRELEEKESNSKFLGIPFKDLRESIEKLSLAEAEGKKSPMQRIDILGHLGRTPDYMLYPPKEELVEKYFHPDNMSASEKLKLELMKVRDEFKMSESDCGSARVQVAQLTTKIKHLSTALHKKDKHSRKGLEAMVQRRKKLLKYLRRTDWDSYCFVLSKLGLRDNVDLAKRGYKN